MVTWQILALIFSFFGAAIIHANHVYKIDGFTAVFLRGFMMLALGVPLGVYLGAPSEPSFYVWAAITGVLITGADVMLLNTSAKHGGRLTAMYIPLKMFFVFIMWSVIDPASLAPLLGEPIKLVVIGICFVTIALALLGFRRCDVGWAALLAVIPIALLFTGADIFAKQAISTSNLVASALLFLSINAIVSSALSALWLKYKKGLVLRTLFTRHNIIGASVMGALLMVGVPVMLVAFALSPNPAYVGAITVLASVWLTIYYKITKGDDASLTASMVLVGSAVLLSLMAPS